MRMRPPAVPLITVDPYFSVWSMANCLTDAPTAHWTGKPMPLYGTVTVDGEEYRFIGAREKDSVPALEQTMLDVEGFTTTYVFEGAGIELTALFTTPALPDDLLLLSRPVSYLEVIVRPLDGEEHSVTLHVSASEQFCLNQAGDDAVTLETKQREDGISYAKIGSVSQPVLHQSGDDIRIDWGYFYLCTQSGTVSVQTREEGNGGMAWVCADVPMEEDTALLAFAYDDIKSIRYFGEPLEAYWKTRYAHIEEAIEAAFTDYTDVFERGKTFSDRLFCDAVRAGGEKYAELLLLSLRQSIGAHKLVPDADGKLLFISKEDFSNGCAATVDVSYPSIPLYLLYNPELVRGMMRPIYRFAADARWKYDFAPHDCGQYPLVDGQVYGALAEDSQMPVEECGNMLLMEAASALAMGGDTSFAEEHIDVLEAWVKYLVENGDDPKNQLCTDDFAGHLAHNCNLTLKAVMGIASLAILYRLMGREEDGERMMAIAKEKAAGFAARAVNEDGSFRLAFDRPGSFSLKYNLVWDQIFGTELFPREIRVGEIARYRKECRAYGVPLDSRRTYTKSDWLVWAATLADNRADFETLTDPLWRAYSESPARVPLTDWYDTVTSLQCGFQNRTVVGGHFMKLLAEKGYLKI